MQTIRSRRICHDRCCSELPVGAWPVAATRCSTARRLRSIWPSISTTIRSAGRSQHRFQTACRRDHAAGRDGGGRGRRRAAVGEAVSSLSGFRLRYEENRQRFPLTAISTSEHNSLPASRRQAGRESDPGRRSRSTRISSETRLRAPKPTSSGVETDLVAHQESDASNLRFNLLCDPPVITHDGRLEIAAAREPVLPAARPTPKLQPARFC